ncbi:class I SAM-dependent methyltransferase [Ilumatobacter sp.]|uniref:class I SAM-dependent methyltransferase n=1 Tax=Ilumatobacter sp. TaxID=1967498 RepID=UPI003B5252EE
MSHETTTETGATEVPTGNTYDKYASTNPVERRMMEGFFSAFDAALDGPVPTSILEVGVGEGIVTARVHERFPDASVVGIDLPDDDLAEHWREAHLACAFGDITALPLPDGCVDLVLAIEVFEHVDDPSAALDEVARVCGGTLVASVPREPMWRIGNMARGRYLRDLGNTPGHVNHWGRRTFERFVDQRFDVMDVATPPPWTMIRARAR